MKLSFSLTCLTHVLLLVFLSSLKSVESGELDFNTWMVDMNNSKTAYGFTLYNTLLFEFIFPGSHKSGMYTQALETVKSNKKQTKNKQTNDTHILKHTHTHKKKMKTEKKKKWKD